MKRLLSSENVREYLARIGIFESVSVNTDGLNRLIRAQLTHIPFEALDVWGAGVCPSLELGDLFQKIVVDHRGGYCFELNTLFRALLNSLGFDAYQVIASLVDEEGVAAPPAHNAIICTIDNKKYFVDVGFGGPVPFFAMELRNSAQGDFRLEKKEDFWYLLHRTEEKEVYFLRFRDTAVEMCELIPLNFYVSQRPDIHFRHILRVNQRKEKGVVYALVDHELTIHRPEGNTVIPVADVTALAWVLKEYFEIDYAKLTIQKEY